MWICIHTNIHTYVLEYIFAQENTQENKSHHQATAVVFQSWMKTPITRRTLTMPESPPSWRAECISLEYKLGFGIFIEASQGFKYTTKT